MKKYFLMLLSIMFVAATSVGFVSCGDDDDTPKPTATGNIHGLVTDYGNANAPIAGATVTLNLKGLTKTTGSDGRYEFTNIEPGTYTIQVMASNYRTTTKQVTVYADQQANCDFQLTESAVTIAPVVLYYGKDVSEMSFTISNNSTNLQNFSISNIPSYLSLSATSGVIPSKGNKVIIATVKNRPEQTQNAKVLVTVGYEDHEINFTVVGTNANSDGGNEGGEGGNSGAGSASGDVTRGLLSYYTFDDGTPKNEKNANNSGTVQNGSTYSYITDTPNGKGKALSLGNKEYVNIPYNAVEGSTAFSVSMWAKDFGNGPLFVSTFSDDNFNGSPRLYVDGNGNFVGDGTEEIHDTSVSLGVSAESYWGSGWHMLTAVYANRQITFYIDGTLKGSASHYSNTKGHGTKTSIGGKANGIWNSPMKVDNVRVYGIALTSAEVAKIYQYEK